MQYEYDMRRSGRDWNNVWRELEEGHQFSTLLEYRFRIKPTFEPGYFRHVDEHGPVLWKVEDPGTNWVRVNVTPIATARQRGDKLTGEDLVALPIGAKVRDRDLDTWTKAPNGCWYITDDGEYANASSGYVMGFGPIHLVSE